MSELTLPYEEYESVDLTEDERSSEENFTDEGSPLNFVNCTLDCTTEETFSSTFAGSSPLTCANKIVPRRPLKQSVRFKNVPNVIKKSETITSQPILSEKKVKKLSPIKPRSNILAETQDIVDVDSKTTEPVCVADKEILSEILPTQNVPIRYQIAQNNIQNQTIYSQKQPGKVVIIKKNNKYYKIVIPHNVMPNINQSTGPVLINIPEVGPLVIRSDPHVTKQNSVPVDQPFSLNLDVHQSQTKNSITPKKVPEISWKETALCDKKFCWTFSKGKKRDLEGFSYNDRLGFNRTEYQKARKCSGILNSIVKKKRTEIIDQMHKFNMFKDSVNKINEEKMVKKKPARGRASKKSITKTKFKADGSTSPPLLTENFKKTHMSLEPMSYDPQNIHCPANETEDDTDYDCDLLMTKKVVILNGRDTKPIAKKRKSKSTHLTRPKRKISNKVKLKRLWAKKLAQHKEIVANDNKVFMLKPCYVEMVRDESVEEAYRNYMRNIGFRRPKTNTNVPRTIQRSTQLGTNCGEYFSDTIQIFKSRVITSVEEFKKEINFLKPLLIVNSNVLKRISNLLALKSTNLQDYGDTELKQYWMPDSVSKECYECSEKFTTFRRRHHCRVCGQIFCSQCCNQQIPGKIFGCTGDLRVCTYCCKVVLSYLQSSDLGADLSTDLKILQENLQTKFGSSISPSLIEDNITQTLNCNIAEVNTLKRKISVGYQEEKFVSGSSNITYLTTEEKCKALQNSTSLRNLFEEICKPTSGIPFETHRHRLRTYTECFLGSELVDWLIFQQKAKNRVQAAAICQALLEGGYIESASEPSSFIDGYAFYKRGSCLSPNLPQQSRNFDVPSQEEPSWVQQIPQDTSMTDSDNEQTSPITLLQGNLTSSSSYMLDLNIEANTVYLSRPPDTGYKSPDSSEHDYREHQETTVVRPSEQRELAPESGWYNVSALRDENGEKLAYSLLSETYEQHEQSLLKQLLSSKGLSHSWSNIVTPLIHDIITAIRPDKNHDAVDLDIKHYVQFKILSGGFRNDTSLIRGIVCSKNVAHKGMLTDVENPKILLLQCSIVYQRTEGRLMSLEPVLMQEHEYLRNVAARIVALQPNVVLVQRNVSRLAQDMLRQHKITLVHNVKQSVLERLSRCTQADLVSAVDSHIGRPKLGTCKRFYLKSFNIEKGGLKTLMFFDGLPFSHLGGTVLLRGASKAELARLKKVTSFLLFTAYNWRLEKSFLMDEFAMPPNSKCEFLEDSKENSPEFPTPKISMADLDTNLINSDVDCDKRNEKAVIRRSKDDKIETTNEGKKITVQTIKDFTDPLHSYAVEDESNKVDTSEKFTVTDLPFSNSFRKSLDDAILCISPYIVFSVPYLETEIGKKCKLRQFFPRDIYFSEQFSNSKKNRFKDTEDGNMSNNNLNNKKIKPIHPFLTTKITSNMDNINVQNMLANFRACGGRYEKKENICIVSKEDNRKNEVELDNSKDVLDPINHQRLAVLFCSFSVESNNAPAFCVNPWVVYMDFYGRNDIPLGCFLERYCFRPTYFCPSKSCDTPMIKHIRRFVHNSGCVSISLNYFENEFAEENIVMWTWCTKCQSVSPVVPLSADTWSYSFAKYLELRFHGDVFTRRGQYSCHHSLHHDHYQYFGYKNYVASFKYTSINIWEVSLPPLLIEINYDVSKFQVQLIDEVRIMAQKGHEIFSLIQDKLLSSPIDELENLGNLKQLLSKEQSQFKQKVEEVQLKLTSPTIENKDFEECELYIAYWKISDVLVKIKRSIVETVDSWNTKLSEATRKKDSDKKEKPVRLDVDNPNAEELSTLEILDEPISNEQEDKETSNLIAKKMRSVDSEYESVPPSPKCHHRSQSDGTVMSQNEEMIDKKESSDKKTVKNILSQLLPSTTTLTLISPPFNVQEHYTLPIGVSIPIIVYENEPSSIVAYTLSSYDYKKALEELTNKRSSEQTPSPISKRKSNNDKEKNDDDKSLSLLGFLRNKDSKADLNSLSPTSAIMDLSHSEQGSAVPDKGDDIKKTRNSHIEIQFQDSNCNFFCRVYLAEKFAALRSSVLPIGEEAYIRSLSRSIQWNARGGKSGSNFAKTADDRFILKDMSRSEVQLFLESAAKYFSYMHKCYSSKQPTLLGKIVGIYQIIFRNNSNITYRSNLLVMENLFYNKKVSQKFDLKGSMRNRLVVPENQEGEIVLLDENLLKMTCDSPLYILPHSKAVLTAAIQNDTEFLSAQSVMDYSLLVGLDSENKELVLGIIDYIRTFTWDKRLETIVKKSGILGGQGKLPTIVSPEEYQKRFIEAMHRYFLEVPDHWAGLGKGLDL